MAEASADIPVQCPLKALGYEMACDQEHLRKFSAPAALPPQIRQLPVLFTTVLVSIYVHSDQLTGSSARGR